MGRERLDKLLAHMRVGTRREIKAMVKQGRIQVDGAIARDPGDLVDPQLQTMMVDGHRIHFRRHFHLLLHKPAGVITATEDARQSTVLDLVPTEYRHPDLFPVGRLDKETEGLLLLTTDGELGHRLLSPRWHVEKLYLARLDLPLDPGDSAAFAAGVTLEDGYTCLPALLEPRRDREALVTVREGKYHQVRRMFAALGKKVLYLQRLAMGPLQLGDLPPGSLRLLDGDELRRIYAAVRLDVTDAL